MPAVITGVGLGLERSSASVLGAAGQWGQASGGQAQNDVFVNAATGNLVVQAADQFLIGLGLNEDVVRTYNSQGSLSQDNGALWSDANSRQILVSSLSGTVNTTGSTIQRVGADGSVFTYSYNSSVGAYQANEGGGAYDTLSFNSSSHMWTWTDGATQDTEVYDNNNGGRIVSASDQTGANTLTYAYDATSGLLSSVTTAGVDPSTGHQESTSFFYVTVNGTSEISYVQTAINNGSGTLATSTYVRYGYDSQGRLSCETTDLTPSDNSVSDSNTYTTNYSYSSTTDLLTSITQSDGTALSFTYDGFGRVSSYTQSLSSGFSTSVNFTYAGGATTVTDSLSQVTALHFDGSGQLTSSVSPLSQTASFTYDSMGDVLTASDPNGNVDTYTYDSRGNQLSMVDSLGDTETKTYAANNRLLTATSYLAPATGTSAAASPLTSTYVYDASNNLAYSISPNDEITQYLYGAAPGEVTETIQYAAVASMPALTLSALNTWSSGSFDKSGAVITGETYNVRGQTIIDSAFSATTTTGGYAFPAVQTVFTYDQAGATQLLFHYGYDATPTGHAFESETASYDGLERVVSNTDANGVTTNFVHSDSASGQNVTATNAANSTVVATASNLAGALLTSTVTALNAPTAVTADAYDSLGRVREVTDPDGVSSYVIYDADGRKAADIAADGSIVTYTYDAENQVIQTIDYADKLSASQLALLTTSGYSAPVSLSSVLPSASSADQTNYSIYDLAGRLSETIDGAGAVMTYQYDGASRLVSTRAYITPISASTYAGYKTSPPTGIVTPGISSLDEATTYAYDDDGRLTQTVNAYGVLNLTTTTTYNAVGEVVAVTDASGAVTRNAYDQAGRLIYTIDGAGDVVCRTYNPDNRLLSMTRYATPLSSGVLAGLPLQVTAAAIAADVTASSSSASLPDDETLSFTYDADGRLLSSSPMGATTTYDALGEVVASTDALGNVTRYAYDGDGRQLFAIDAAGAVTQTTYNGAGQAVALTTYATALTSSQLSALAPATIAAMTPTALVSAISADVTSSPGHDETTRSVYDADGRLAYSFDPANRVTEYDYDTQGRVVQATAYATAVWPTTYSYASVQSAITTNANDRVTRTVYDGEGRIAFTIDADGGVTGFAYDAFGNTVQTVDYLTAFTTSGPQSLSAMQSWSSAHAMSTGTVADRISRQVYDTDNRLVFSVDPVGDVTQMTYDADGRVVAVRAYATALTSSQLAALPTAPTAAAITADLTASSSDQITRSVYDSAGQLIYSIDAVGDVTQNSYDGAAHLAAVRAYATPLSSSTLWGLPLMASETAISADVTPSSSDHITRYVYDANNNLRYIVDAAGGVSAMNYDAAGRLTSTTVYATALSGSAFGSLALVTSVATVAGLATTSAADETTSYTYDAVGRQLVKTDAMGRTTTSQYDVFGNVVKLTDGRGDSGYSYYNLLKQLVLQVDPSGDATATAYSLGGAVTSVTRYANLATGTLSTATAPTIATSAGDATTQIGRDKLDRITSNTDADGNTQSYVLDIFGDQIQVANALGGVTANVYDGRGLLISTTIGESAITSSGSTEATSVNTSYGYDAFGNRTVMVEANGLSEQRITYYSYDALDRLASRSGDAIANTWVNAVGFVAVAPTWTTQYDAFGNVIRAVDADGDQTFYYYDVLNRKVAEVDAMGALSAWTYDAFDKALSARVYGDFVSLPSSAGGSAPSPISSSNYRQTNYTYDKDNEQTSTSIANVLVGAYAASSYSSSTNYVYSTTAITTQTGYDADGNVITRTDADGSVSHFYYQANGLLQVSLDGQGMATTYGYDSQGDVTSQQIYYDPATVASIESLTADGKDQTTFFTYDKNGDRLSETRANVTGSTVNSSGVLSTATSGATITYTYNALGEVTSKTQATGDQVQYVYDSMGRQTEIKSAAFNDYTGTSVQSDTHQYYDGLNNLTRTTVGVLGASSGLRVTANTYGAGGRLTVSTDAAGFSTGYNYDGDGNLVLKSDYRLQSSGASVLEYSFSFYDALGRTSSQYVQNLIGSAFVQGDTTTTAYDAYGETTSKALNGVTIASFGYDQAGRLANSTANGGVQQFFVHDGVGNTTLEIDSTGANLTGVSLATVLSSDLDSKGEAISSLVSGLATTITTYDAHGDALQTIGQERQLNTTSTPTTLTETKTYDEFGEVLTDADSFGSTTSFTYDTLGKVTQEVLPSVSATALNGAVSAVTPTLNYAYDLGGRMVGSEDADGNWTSRSLLAGSGYDGSGAVALATFTPDGAVSRQGVDVFGDVRTLTNGLGAVESRTYDAMDRVVSDTQPVVSGGTALTTYYSYDGLGQRLTQSNSQFAALAAADSFADPTQTTDYDMDGRVVRSTDYSGHVTTYAYAINTTSTTSTAGLGSFGGWVETEVNAAGLTETTDLDAFGRTVAMTDFGGNTYSDTYDKGGRLVGQANSLGQTLANSWYNTGKLAGTLASFASGGGGSSLSSTTQAYTYDQNGNRLSEQYSGTYELPYDTDFGGSAPTASTTYESATAVYDPLNRLVEVHEAAEGGAPEVSTGYYYDAAGNVRETSSSFSYIGSTTPQSQDDWFTYDALNRVLISDGTLSGTRGSGSIVLTTSQGSQYSYDAAGERVSATTLQDEVGEDRDGDPYEGTNTHVETYGYDPAGYLILVSATDDNLDGLSDGDSDDYTVATYARDALGRTLSFTEDNADTSTAYTSVTTYDFDNETVEAVDDTWSGSTDTRDTTTFSYQAYVSGAGYTGAYEGGQVTQSDNAHEVITGGVPGSGGGNATTVNSYVWTTGIRETGISYSANYPTSTTSTTSFDYDANGNLSAAYVSDGAPRSISYITDAAGQVMRRTQASSASVNPQEDYFYFDGVQVASIGNDGTAETDFADAVAAHNPAPGTGVTSFATFGDNPTPIDPDLPAAAPASADSHYTVQAGDTLSSIASSLWGDASLWYLIADDNALSGSETLAAGQILNIPAKVTDLHDSASTFTVYDPSKAIGNVQPTVPKPTSGHKSSDCGGVGEVLEVVIAVAVAAVVGPEVAGALAGPLGGTAAGTIGGAVAAATDAAIGDTAAQGFGLLTGIQSQFSFSQLALSALSAGIGSEAASLPGVSQLDGSIESAFGQGVGQEIAAGVNGAIGNAITQGIGVATGLQSSFDWSGVAAAGVSAGVFKAVGGSTATGFAKALDAGVSGVAGAIAGAASKSVLTGTDFGTNLETLLPQVIGQTIGNLIADAQAQAATQPSAIAKNIVGIANSIPGMSLTADQQAALQQQAATLIAQAQSLGQSSDPSDQIKASALQNQAMHLMDSYATTPQAQAYLGQAYGYLGQSPSTPSSSGAGAGGTSVDLSGDVVAPVVTAVPYGSALGLLDRPLDSAGVFSNQVTGSLNSFVADHPAAGTALQILNVGLLIAGGPEALVAGLAIGAGQGAASQAVTNRFNDVHFSQGIANSAGTGVTFLSSIAIAGFGISKFGSGLFGAAESAAPKVFADGSFSVTDWTGYPEFLPKPAGPMNLLETGSDELVSAQRLKAVKNDELREAFGLRGVDMDIHEIQPVKFGGSPTDLSNKLLIPRDLHQQVVTPFWNGLTRDLEPYVYRPPKPGN